MTNAQEKRVNRIAAHKGFRLEKAGHGKGHGRFYIMNVAEGGRMRSDVPDHEYSFLCRRPKRGLLSSNDFAPISGNSISYIITGTDSAGALSLKRDSAAAAIKKGRGTNGGWVQRRLHYGPRWSHPQSCRIRPTQCR
jgi:hypothetical protein